MTDAAAFALTLQGEVLHLLPERALWWPTGRTLFVADVHLGKAASFRALGQPVPSGTTAENLDRLTALLHGWPAQRLVFLGDLLHAAHGRAPRVLSAVAAWREAWSTVEMVLVRGNHDDRAGDPPPAWGIEAIDEPWRLGPWACCHHPQSVPGACVLAGHLHPVCHLRGPGRDRLRLPCFVRDADALILPAFGAFTGGHRVEPDRQRQCYAVGAGRVWPLTGG